MKTLILIAGLAVLQAAGAAPDIQGVISLYEHGKFQGAADAAAGLIRKAPEDADLRLWAGKTFLKLRRWDDAVREFRKAVEISPRSGSFYLWLGRAYGRKAEHAFFAFAMGPAGKARENFETAVRLSPDNLDARFDLLDFYSQAPSVIGGGRSKAEAQAAEIAKISPRAGYSARAAIYEDNGEWEKARQELVQATVKYPEDADGYMDLAAFQLERKDFAGAEASAQKACSLAKASRRARYYLAAAQIELNRNLASALKSMQELSAGPLSDDDPSFAEVYYWVGRAFLAENRPSDARQAFQASLGFDPDFDRSRQALKQIR